MRRVMRLAPCVVGALLVLCTAQTAAAYPFLQLDIKNGEYESSSETIVATSRAFTLYAYLTPPSNTTSQELNALLNSTFYVSAALTPKVFPPGANLGTFSFNNTTVRATQDMVYGDPPIERYLGGSATYDSGDLAKHDIYETYFKEFSFKFNKNQKAIAYDTQVNTGAGPTTSSQGGMYYMAFTVNTSQLNPNYQIHFDMYNEVVKNGGDLDVNKFAPFSHDAQSMVLPEPGTLVLVGSGIAALAARRRRRRAG
jgi:hypothetical protein